MLRSVWRAVFSWMQNQRVKQAQVQRVGFELSSAKTDGGGDATGAQNGLLSARFNLSFGNFYYAVWLQRPIPKDSNDEFHLKLHYNKVWRDPNYCDTDPETKRSWTRLRKKKD